MKPKLNTIEEAILDSEKSAEIKRDIEWAIDINNTWANILVCLIVFEELIYEIYDKDSHLTLE